MAVWVRWNHRGEVVVYVPGRNMPVTMSPAGWLRVLDARDEILAFLEEHAGEIK